MDFVPSNANEILDIALPSRRSHPSPASLPRSPPAECFPTRAACIKTNKWIKAWVSVNRQWYLSERCSPSVPVWHTSVGSNKEPLPPPARDSCGSTLSQHERAARLFRVAPPLQMCTKSRCFLFFLCCFFFVLAKRWSLQTEWSVSKKKGRSTSNTQHSLLCRVSVPPLVTAGTCTDCAVPSCPSVLKRWRTYSCKAISCLRLHSTKTNVKKKQRKWQNDSKYMYCIWELHGGKSTIYIQAVLAKPWDTWV